MVKTIELKNIKPNPFNARVNYEEKAINELAKEIDKVGLWTGALRGRMKDGKIELCFGHRRLAALKKLGHKEAPVDIVNLSDKEMAQQGMAENFQRLGLNDMEKANGIKRYVEVSSQNGSSKEGAYEELRIMLGYESTQAIKDLLVITEYTPPVQRLISERKITGRVASAADRLGGEKMVKTAVAEGLSQHKIEKLSQSLDKIPDEKIKEKLRAKVIAGDITEPVEIEKTAEPMLRAKKIKGEPPPDLMVVISLWTRSIKDWRKELEQVAAYRQYLDTQPKIAGEFRQEVRSLIADLEKLL